MSVLKKKKDAKNFYTHFFSEKLYTMPFVSEKLKIICINKNFDRVWRKNFLDCIDSIKGDICNLAVTNDGNLIYCNTNGIIKMKYK